MGLQVLHSKVFKGSLGQDAEIALSQCTEILALLNFCRAKKRLAELWFVSEIFFEIHFHKLVWLREAGM